MNIRGRGGLGSGAPLVLVDGFERGLTNMTIEEIESVQVLKDGAATALMGARGANGVILVNTKRGIYSIFLSTGRKWRMLIRMLWRRTKRCIMMVCRYNTRKGTWNGLRMVRIRIIIRTSTGIKRVQGISAKTISLM